MGSRNHSLAQLWQLPLLLLSLGLFGYAAYLFIDPQPGLTIGQKLDVARVYLRNERPEASLEQLNRLLTTEKLPRENEAAVHLLLAESLEAAQRQKRISIPANHARIIEQTQIAMAQGAKPTGEMHRRLGESYEALNRPTEALSNYRQAIAMTPHLALRMQRRVIAMQMAQADPAAAEPSIDDYLASKDITDSERAWALGEKAQLLADREAYVPSRELLAKVARLDSDPIAQGQVNFRLGYCAWKLGAIDEAERYLRMARDQLRVQHPLDGEAAYVLGRIYQDRNDAAQAHSFFQIVLGSHPDNRVAPLARLGRGVCRIIQGEDDAGLADLRDLVEQIGAKGAGEKVKIETVSGLRQAAEVLSAKQNYQGALELLAFEQRLEPEPPAAFFARLAAVYEKRAEQVDRTVADAAPAERVRRAQAVREFRTKAGDAYLAFSRALTLANEGGYGAALWKGVELYDQAPNLQSVVSALELFVAERPDDALAPDALLRLGNAYHAAGQFDKAVESHKRNQFRYPNTLAACKAGVPLAQAYIAKGPEDFAKAETVLIRVVDQNPLLTPAADEFKQGLFELAQLYYRTERFELAVARFEELTRHYPKDDQRGRLLFLMGDSYRKGAQLLDTRLASADAGSAGSGAAEAAESLAAKRERLAKARGLYDQSIEFFRATPPSHENDKLYQKLSHFYRADCVYDLGNYDEAIHLYDAAAFRYQEDPSALAAYVQIVNSYCALGKIEEAKTANERAKWLLRRMPNESFAEGGFSMPKAYWEQWLKWTSASGMW